MHLHTVSTNVLGCFCLIGFVTVASAQVRAVEWTLLIANSGAGSVTRFDGLTGEFAGLFVPPGSGGLGSECLTAPTAIAFGPDGKFYVASGGATDVVLRYDGVTGDFLNIFVSDGAGGLDEPSAMVFGADGHLYVSSKETDAVLRYDGTSGAFMNAFVSTGSGGLDEPFGLVFGPDGHLYVNSVLTETIIRYDGASGAFMDVFADDSVIDFFENLSLVFGPGGDLYVTSAHPGKVVRFDGTTGVAIEEFITPGSGGLEDPIAMRFGPDGHMYLLDYALDLVLRYDGASGAFMDTFIPAGSGSMRCPYDLVFAMLPPPACPPSLSSDVVLAPAGSSGAIGEARQNRYLNFLGGNPGQLTAVQVTFLELPGPWSVWEGTQLFVQEPVEISERADRGLERPCTGADPCTGATFRAATLGCNPFYTDWAALGVMQVWHRGIVPTKYLAPAGPIDTPARYEIRELSSTCTLDPAGFSGAVVVQMSGWGDKVGEAPGAFVFPDPSPTGVTGVTVLETTSHLAKFTGRSNAPPISQTDILGVGTAGPISVPDGRIDVGDLTSNLDAFRGGAYPFTPGSDPRPDCSCLGAPPPPICP